MKLLLQVNFIKYEKIVIHKDEPPIWALLAPHALYYYKILDKVYLGIWQVTNWVDRIWKEPLGVDEKYRSELDAEWSKLRRSADKLSRPEHITSDGAHIFVTFKGEYVPGGKEVGEYTTPALVLDYVNNVRTWFLSLRELLWKLWKLIGEKQSQMAELKLQKQATFKGITSNVVYR